MCNNKIVEKSVSQFMARPKLTPKKVVGREGSKGNGALF